MQTTTRKIMISQIIREAWHNVSGLKAPVMLFYALGSIVMLVLMSVISSTVSSMIDPYSTSSPDPRSWPIAISLFITFLLEWYILSITIILGVKKALGLPVQIKSAFFDCWSAKTKLLLLFLIYGAFIISSFMISVITPNTGVIGVLLRIIKPIIFIGLEIPLLIFTLPLVVTQQSNLLEALKSSYRKMRQHGLVVMTCFLIIALMIAISVIAIIAGLTWGLSLYIVVIALVPISLGLIWSLPLYFAFTGVMFREAYELSLIKK